MRKELMDYSTLSAKSRDFNLKKIPGPGSFEGGVAINKETGINIKIPHRTNQMEENKCNIAELNKLLFAQLERLSDGKLKDNDLNSEINRSNALANISCQIISAGNLVLKAKTVLKAGLPKMLEG